jgi:hypothetical protein
MNLEQLPAAIFGTLICVIAGMGLWYLGISRGSLKLKQIAVMVGIFPLFVAGIAFFAAKLEPSHEFREGLVFGPASRHSGPVTEETQFYVNRPDKTHRLELRPQAWGGDIPREDVHLRYWVRSPSGEVLTQAEADARPDKNKLSRWTSIFAEFRPHEEGTHKIAVEVPAVVGSVDLWVRESK